MAPKDVKLEGLVLKDMLAQKRQELGTNGSFYGQEALALAEVVVRYGKFDDALRAAGCSTFLDESVKERLNDPLVMGDVTELLQTIVREGSPELPYLHKVQADHEKLILEGLVPGGKLVANGKGVRYEGSVWMTEMGQTMYAWTFRMWYQPKGRKGEESLTVERVTNADHEIRMTREGGTSVAYHTKDRGGVVLSRINWMGRTGSCGIAFDYWGNVKPESVKSGVVITEEGDYLVVEHQDTSQPSRVRVKKTANIGWLIGGHYHCDIPKVGQWNGLAKLVQESIQVQDK